MASKCKTKPCSVISYSIYYSSGKVSGGIKGVLISFCGTIVGSGVGVGFGVAVGFGVLGLTSARDTLE